MNNLATIIRQIAQTGQRPTIIVGQVTARDDDARTIDVQPSDGSAPLLGVALQSSTEGTTGIVTYPAIGSTVAVAMLTGYDAGFCILTDEVESIETTIGEMTLTANADAAEVKAGGTKATLTINADGSIAIDAQSITINGGKLGGLVNVGDLRTALRSIRSSMHWMVTTFNSHTHTVNTTGTATEQSGATSSPLTSTSMQEFQYWIDNCEDTKVKH
ncbi:MAG: hypothetical protein E7070_05230 [Bacteroidales bacterium]|nr:hypothetical protein [Bacteroidales bacterium]